MSSYHHYITLLIFTFVNTPLFLSYSGSGSDLSGKPTPTNVSQVPAACCLSRPMLGSELGPALRALSQAAQEIMEIRRVDLAGCEDPDLDTDTSAHTLHELQQELRLMTEGTDTHLQYIHQSCMQTPCHCVANYDQHITLYIMFNNNNNNNH